jgi:adenylate cyclase
MPLSPRPSQFQNASSLIVVVLVALLLIGLPVAAWLDLRALSERILNQQVSDMNHIIDEMRDLYGREVVGRIMDSHIAIPTHQFRTTENGIPIPSTFSLELGKLLSKDDDSISYRFISDYPFKNRAPHHMDDFERGALTALRANPTKPVVKVSGQFLDREIRFASPIRMGAACVACHNSHPESPKRNWKVGDVRGIQEIKINRPIAASIFDFKSMLSYLVLAAVIGAFFIFMHHRQAAKINGINRELTSTNDFLSALSVKIAKYLPPQIYKSIFAGDRDVTVTTERKKLTIFFSDIKDFTASTERLQPEELTGLLNEYLTEMSAIALRNGATVDKFIGDAILLFFGDPESKGAAEDARACVRTAIEMQQRLAELNVEWRRRGIERPFRARMGINTGYCNVGNFGSEHRMEYTIIGAEANLAAHLQYMAEPGAIVMSYETYALVRDVVRAHAMEPITMKGISRTVVPYVIEGAVGELSQSPRVISEQSTGVDLFLDLDVIEKPAVERTRRLLQQALSALDSKVDA